MIEAQDDQTFWDEVEAYCGRLSIKAGQSVPLHVSTICDQFEVMVERWGAERTVVWRSEPQPGHRFPVPDDASAAGCDWPVALTIPTGTTWPSGFYLVTITGGGAQRGRDTSYACFVVRPESSASQASAVLVLATNTWNAYNTWGGRSLYTGGHQVSFRRPFGRGLLCRPETERDDRKARPVYSGEAADADGEIFQQYRTTHGYPSAIGSAGWFTHERRFVEWAEAGGYRFDMAVSSDFVDDPHLLDGYKTVMSVGHDEYWTRGGRDAIDTHIAGGGRFASFSGNTMFWQVRPVAAAADPTDHSAAMVCYKYAAHEHDPVLASDPELMAGMWCDPVVNRPEWSTLGAGSAFGLYHRFGQATPYGVGGFLVVDPEHWLFAHTGLGYGDVVGRDDGVVGYETVGTAITFDEQQCLVAAPLAGQAPEVEIAGFTLSSNLGVGDYPKSIAALSDQGDLEFVASRYFAQGGEVSDQHRARARRGNAVMLTCRPFGPEGGEVVTIGTTDWVFGLGGDQPVQQITANVLDRFGLDRDDEPQSASPQ